MSIDKLAWTDYLENHYFIFGQQGRVPYTTAMEFGSDGTVKNYPAFNESRWQLNDDELVLLDGNGGPTTTFPLPATPQAVASQGLVGHYLKDDQVVHTLRARDGSGFAPELVDLIVHRVQDQVHHDVRTTAENAARMVPKHQRIRVAFLLQSMETLPALEPLITLVHGDDRFEMKLLVTNKMFDYVESQNTLPEVAAYFSQRGYAFIEVTGDGTEAVAGLHRWQADFIVRQSEWDADYLPALSAEHLDWSRLIHVPYTITESALNLPNSDHQSLLVNPYYEHVWRYFTPEPLSAEQLHAIGGSFVARDIFQYVGSMKAR
ncbi:hypothetical protein [Lacticaseibacillus thailandensis]|uniref:hypothetical protein n=1 Tax=Lacticaseibacillus thailandensis TaxID=381741 RepID=UPI0006D07B8E|nr:hypothetical protein [Lacticaseibacillus thailandensis]